ncbi:MAG: hypothetical protein R2788_07025 [Saprospiraceae bacterium]
MAVIRVAVDTTTVTVLNRPINEQLDGRRQLLRRSCHPTVGEQ